jgi:hypothetical protein
MDGTPLARKTESAVMGDGRITLTRRYPHRCELQISFSSDPEGLPLSERVRGMKDGH